MRITRKPVRACYGCLLNMGQRCWGYEFPHRQWRDRRRCPGYDNPEAYALYREWLEQPSVKTTRELRRDAYPRRKTKRVYHLENSRNTTPCGLGPQPRGQKSARPLISDF